MEVSYSAKKGIIESISIRGDFFSSEDISALENKLIGVSLEREELTDALADVGRYVHGAACEDMISLFV